MATDVFISDFYCTQCGNKIIPLPRKVSKQHEPGHLKNLYCFHCKKEVNAVEIRPFGKYTVEEFKIEYKMGNFNENGKRKEPYKQCLVKYYKKEENKNDI